MKDVRELTVQGEILPPARNQRARIKPKLLLCGWWLEAANIFPGGTVKIIVNQDGLVIKPF